MTTPMMLIIFLVSMTISSAPLILKYTSFLDTILHEVGHGIVTSPLGSPLPEIRIRSNASGENRSTAGMLVEILPNPFSFFMFKLSRLLNLLSGYPFSLVFASLLLSLSINQNEVEVNPWIGMSLFFIVVSTLAWTGSEIRKRPILLALLSLSLSAITAYTLDLGWWSLAVGGIYAVALLLSSSILTVIGIISTILGIVSILFAFIPNYVNNMLEIGGYFPSSLSNRTVVEYLLMTTIFYALASSRTIFSLSIVGVGGLIMLGSILQPWWDWRISAVVLAGILFSSGIKSLFELYQLTFVSTTRKENTDLVYASEELGFSPKIWFFVLVGLTISFIMIILF